MSTHFRVSRMEILVSVSRLLGGWGVCIHTCPRQVTTFPSICWHWGSHSRHTEPLANSLTSLKEKRGWSHESGGAAEVEAATAALREHPCWNFFSKPAERGFLRTPVGAAAKCVHAHTQKQKFHKQHICDNFSSWLHHKWNESPPFLILFSCGKWEETI